VPGTAAWLGVVALAFALAWALAAPVVLLLERGLAEPQRELLAWFGVFAAPTPPLLLAQLARGALLAAALAPFRAAILRRGRPQLPLLGAVVGLVAIGSVEPLPGSLEGWFYTETSPAAHLVTLVGALLQGVLVAVAVPRLVRLAWRAGAGAPGRDQRRPRELTRGRLVRFTVVHAATYLAAGLAFFSLQDYTAAFASDPQFVHFRPLDDPWVAAAIPGQLLRGPLLAVALAPFVAPALRRRGGGPAFFALLFVTTAAATGHLLPGLLGATPEPLTLASLATGLPEVAVQMAAFTWLFLTWERRATGAPSQESRP
jgi:hypothetical protein